MNILHALPTVSVPALGSMFIGLGPLGTWEIIIIAALLLIMGLVVGGIVFLVIYLDKKK